MTRPPRRKARRWGYDSRGTPAVLMLPGCLALVLLGALPLLVPDLMQRCIGRTVEPPRGKAGVVYMTVEAVCAPLLFFGPGREIALGLTLVALLIAVWWSGRWIKAHQAHWDVIRARERKRRAAKRAAKAKPPDAEKLSNPGHGTGPARRRPTSCLSQMPQPPHPGHEERG